MNKECGLSSAGFSSVEAFLAGPLPIPRPNISLGRVGVASPLSHQCVVIPSTLWVWLNGAGQSQWPNA